MPKKTQKQALIDALTVRGWKPQEGTQLTKYVPMGKGDDPTRLFVGKMGALRRGRVVSKSVPIAEKVRQQLLKEGGYSDA